MPFSGITLSLLNNYMKNYPSGIIVPDQYIWHSLWDLLRADLKKDAHRGEYVEILLRTTREFTGKAHTEDADVPLPPGTGFDKAYIPMRELIANAGITRQAQDAAVGGDASWGRVVDLALQDMQVDFNLLCELSAFNDGSGRLARVSAAADNGGVVTITCDNNYLDFGIENVQLIRKGLRIDIYQADGVTPRLLDQKVTSVTFGARNNGAATTGTFTVSHAPGHGIANGDVVYIRGRADYRTTGKYTAAVEGGLPIGLLGFVQNGTQYIETGPGTSVNMALFQGVDRTSIVGTAMRARMYTAADFASGGVAGVPDDWDLSVISDAISENYMSTGGKTNALLCSSQLAMAIQRRNKAESNITVNVSTTSNMNQTAAGAQYASQFLCPDGRVIPIHVCQTIPRNVLYGLTTEDIGMYTKGDFDYLRLTGDIWMKSPADRKTNFEAPYGGYVQLGAERCDRQWVIQDMKDNI
jgi:hypothetical protein